MGRDSRRTDPSPFGRILKNLRLDAGFTQDELATIAGLSVNAVSLLERGERRWPHPETVRALAAALDLSIGARAALLAAARRGQPEGEGAVSHIPLPPYALVGRHAELKGLIGLLGKPSARLVTLIGPGGVGKTRLATEAAMVLERRGHLDVRFVHLAPLGDSALVAPAIAEALGLGDVQVRVLPEAAAAVVRFRPTLLVLDNFEHVGAAAPLVAEMLAGAANLQVLATSRAPLRLRGEVEWSLSPLTLPGPGAVSLSQLERSAAGRLFLERIRELRPDYLPRKGEARTLAAICARLDALPLALELAAAWLKLLAPEEILERLTSGAPLPALAPGDTPARHRSLDAVVTWSYELLDEESRRFFRRLAVLPGGCTVRSAAAVAMDDPTGAAAERQVIGHLARLVEHNLLLRHDGPDGTRYRMLETVRVHAMERLESAADCQHAVEGLVRYLLALASEATLGQFGPEQVRWVQRLNAEIDNIRAALSRLLGDDRQAGARESAARILGGMGIFWMIGNHMVEGLDWCERVLADPRPLSDAVHARLLIAGAMAATPRYLTEQLSAFLDRAISLAESAGDVDALALGLFMRGHSCISVADVAGATPCFERSLALFRERRIAWGQGMNFVGLAHARVGEGDFDGADRLLLKARTLLTLLHEAGSWYYGITFNFLAYICVFRERPRESIPLALEAIDRLEPLHDRCALPYSLIALAAACADMKADLLAARILGALDAVLGATGVVIKDEAPRGLLVRCESLLRARDSARRLDRARAGGRETPIAGFRRDLERLLKRSEVKALL